MSVKTNPLHYDNCKNCASRCEHAGKDREFVYRESSCKVVKKRTRFDRSAWEPCDFCGKELDDYPYIVAHSDYDESNTCYTPAFCPVCGRPLTDAAWEIKRLEGARK